MKKYEKIELDQTTWDNSREKNKRIADSASEYLAVTDAAVLSAQELIDMAEEYRYLDICDVLVLCVNGPEGHVDLTRMLLHPQMEILGFLVRKSDLQQTGRFNEQLDVKTNWEFLCRVSEKKDVLCLACSDVETVRDPEVEITLAYQLVKQMQFLSKQGQLETALQIMISYAQSLGRRQELEQALQYLLDHPDDLVRIQKDTGPVFIIKGTGNVCYGILQYMADELADACRRLGEAVIVYDGTNPSELERLTDSSMKMVIAFQAKLLIGNGLSHIHTKKIQFWFDDPIPYLRSLRQVDKETYYFCQDENHARFLSDHQIGCKVIQLPPGGSMTTDWENTDRPYDILFMGTYIDLDRELARLDLMEPEQKRLAAIYLSRSLDEPRLSSEEQLRRIYQEQKEQNPDLTYEQVLDAASPVIKFPAYGYRKAVVDTILQAGYELHVFGDSWNNYRPPEESQGKPCRLVIHPQVHPHEVGDYMCRAKISLNVMSWHKGGMTERIADAMLAGAVCLTDETSFLRTHFEQFEDIVMFSLDHLQEIPHLIAKLLSDEDCRKRIAKKAYVHASREYTWDRVADYLMAFAADDTRLPDYTKVSADR